MNASRLDALVREQEQVERLDRETIEAIQLKKLNRLLAKERARAGFYREMPERLQSLGRLSDLPFTTDEDLAHHAGAMLLTSQSEIRRVLSDATSGTTGAAKRVFYSENDLERTVQLYMAGLGELIFPGSVTMIAFPFSGAFGLGELIADAVERLGARPIKAGPRLSYGELSALLEKERPDTFVGMPVQLLSLLRVCGRESLRRALVSGDACPETVLRGCETILGSSLFPHYGSREMGMAGAITCPAHVGMHLRENHVIAEIVDREGRVLPKGETGELVITTIGMEALPLIRYRTGDYTRILPEPCPCGCELLRLDSLRRGGEEGTMAELDDALFSIPDLVDYRITKADKGILIRAFSLGAEPERRIRKALGSHFAQEKLTIKCRAPRLSDRALYSGKRAILRAGE